MDQRVKRETFTCCLTCGYTGQSFVLVSDELTGRLAATSRCVKCSNTAYTCNIQGLFRFMQAVTKEMVSMKSDIFDIEDSFDRDSGDTA